MIVYIHALRELGGIRPFNESSDNDAVNGGKVMLRDESGRGMRIF